MKIKIVKKGTVKVKPSGYCPYFLDGPPETQR
jgi:hypothetical protein